MNRSFPESDAAANGPQCKQKRAATVHLWLYRALYPFALLIGSPFYLRRMWRRGGYREGFSHRFGRVPSLPAKREGVSRLWLQAVSVGELLAVAPLLEAWAREGHEVYLTTTTSTGYRLARERYGALTIGIGYLPLDWWPFSRNAWAAVQPDVALLMEGERWPEHIAQAARRGVSVVCLNARLSDRSFRRMRRCLWAIEPLFGGITKILACAEEDARRFRALGFAPDRVITTGNMKLDVAVPVLDAGAKAQLRSELGLRPVESGELILMGASTWPGEEAALISALRSLRVKGIACSLLLVPRHAERRAEIVAVLRESGFRYRIRSEYLSESRSDSECVDVSLADTTGELQRLLQVADLVFVGKSLPPHTEGQTPVEAAILGRAILFGPGMGSFRQIARELVDCGAARVVGDSQALAAQACKLLLDSEKREAMGAAGRAWHAQNVGALARTLEATSELFAKPAASVR
ncbi:3-deoxy-D-manno-octulosonic acid transferase [Cephaloticoccus capnophilus]|uniref:3-deoxy-D-manno-octulosonic acid transferase n=1 Tax=Cephaloticoccus capnophilus TaxID=1548208 RepID=UPI0009EECDD8|nr:glycosyltransferase N-terminal domain-containing protein [Cephaloticoccus capnophilus]